MEKRERPHNNVTLLQNNISTHVRQSGENTWSGEAGGGAGAPPQVSGTPASSTAEVECFGTGVKNYLPGQGLRWVSMVTGRAD